MSLKGTVTNVTNFGAFVDIGVHQDGLIHISELSDTFVKDPSQVVSVGTVLTVRVLEVDVPRRRISLSCKSPSAERPQQAARSAPRERSGAEARPNQGASGQTPPRKPVSKAPEKQFTMNDLLSKFNKK
jgi:uncharacterized protein